MKPFTSNIDIIPPKSGTATNVGLELRADTPDKFETILQKSKEFEDIAIALPI